MAASNILFIMADQMSAKALPFYGHPLVLTPALSYLAGTGVLFETAYCNSPLCGPSRLSMMAGLLPHRIGAYDNAPEFSATTPTFAHYLRLQGYLTCLSGKMHFAGPDQLHGYEERLTSDIYPADFGWTPNWAEPDAKVTFQDMQNVVEAGPCARSMQIDYDDEVADRAVRWLYDQARKPARHPFMLTVSFTSPHDPYVALPEFWDFYREEEIDLPAVPAIALEAQDAHSARIHAHYSIGDVEMTPAMLRRTRQGYYASVSYIDEKIGRLMRTLERAGLAEDTIVVMTSDHGDMMGERGLFYKKSFFEWSSRVPLLIHAPGRYAARRVAEPVSLLDLLATFHELAGGDAAEILESDGMSLVAALEGRFLPQRCIPGEFLAEGVFEPTFMLRDRRYKLFHSENDPPLLFDLEADPLELTDLSQSPGHAAALAALRAEAAALWDSEAIKAAVIADQNRRRLVQRAHNRGRPPNWDYQPFVDASQQWVRAGKWTVEVEATAHLDLPETG